MSWSELTSTQGPGRHTVFVQTLSVNNMHKTLEQKTCCSCYWAGPMYRFCYRRHRTVSHIFKRNLAVMDPAKRVERTSLLVVFPSLLILHAVCLFSSFPQYKTLNPPLKFYAKNQNIQRTWLAEFRHIANGSRNWSLLLVLFFNDEKSSLTSKLHWNTSPGLHFQNRVDSLQIRNSSFCNCTADL